MGHGVQSGAKYDTGSIEVCAARRHVTTWIEIAEQLAKEQRLRNPNCRKFIFFLMFPRYVFISIT